MSYFTTINPFNLEEIDNYKKHADAEVQELIERSYRAFRSWRKTSNDERSRLLISIAAELRKSKQEASQMMSMEMGKPISQANAEIEKCAWVCEYFAEQGPGFLSNHDIRTEASLSYVKYEPLGPVLTIMPWNFPFWQVFRFLAPAILVGNSVLLKHAPNVFGSTFILEKILIESGMPEDLFQNLVIDVDQVAKVIGHDSVRAVTLTGSGRAGASVASIAGKYVKKCVLELGGSNSLIVFEDADIKKAVELGVAARMQNNGQSCIAAKRFLIQASVYDQYRDLFEQKALEFQLGDPLSLDTKLGPLARVDLAQQLEDQVNRSILEGAKVTMGGTRNGAAYSATILEQVAPGMAAFDEELFGPVAAFTRFETEAEALELANRTAFGLGSSLFTCDENRIHRMITEFEDGAVFINEMVKSDPRLPFGGTKSSGYGRELGRYGIYEFANIKTVYKS